MEFEAESLRFFELVRAGQMIVLVSPVVVEELSDAPVRVREVFQSLPPNAVVPVELTHEVIELRDAYMAAGIVSPRFIDDATLFRDAISRIRGRILSMIDTDGRRCSMTES